MVIIEIVRGALYEGALSMARFFWNVEQTKGIKREIEKRCHITFDACVDVYMCV